MPFLSLDYMFLCYRLSGSVLGVMFWNLFMKCDWKNIIPKLVN